MVVTDAAQDKWMKLMEDLELDADDTHLRVAIKGGGCSGFQKKLDYCQTKDITLRIFDIIKLSCKGCCDHCSCIFEIN